MRIFTKVSRGGNSKGTISRRVPLIWRSDTFRKDKWEKEWPRRRIFRDNWRGSCQSWESYRKIQKLHSYDPIIEYFIVENPFQNYKRSNYINTSISPTSSTNIIDSLYKIIGIFISLKNNNTQMHRMTK